ncbi:hypothetical protein COCOR_02721 [Corallococcus coralloides DSM 2259]|uniref:Lipoprotein n=1 Tax=Corallococcus coralloides (strain ATCC 25202 / DSM 2259 / NBRC 100086 / M2) TaxID=1144275 RepID=H8MVF6_CORCM|nr:hypothetical protein [Corallococcus coralloides]AFE04779.1 hypothetical protein COCOR_02721 [Corallococcus coralloides DSM 2259]
MMRYGALLLGCAAVWGTGCKKEQPQASAPVDAGVVAAGVPDAGSVAKGPRPLRFSNVVLKRQDDTVNVSYTLTNPGTAQGRGDACLMLVDDQNRAIAVSRLGGITVKGGLEDAFEDTVKVADLQWKQARSVMLYSTEYGSYCSTSDLKPISEFLRLLPTGAPAPAGLPVPAQPQDVTSGDFAVSGIRVNQAGSSAGASVTYTVKNVSDHRAAGTGCLRAYAQEGTRALEELEAGEFDLAPNASETRTATLKFADATHWAAVKVLRFFASPYGCVDTEGPENPGFPLSGPSEVQPGDAAPGGTGSGEAHHDEE